MHLPHHILALILLMLSACHNFAPAEPPAEYAYPPASTPLWNTLAEMHPGDWQLPLNVGAQALDWRLRAIDSATASIDLQTFLWSFDTVGGAILTHLQAAAERGVRIRLLVDDSFLAGEEPVFLSLEAHPNIEYRVYNPYLRRSNSMVTRTLLNLGEFHRLDHRMHNKAMVVDNQIAIVGGRNLADEYFGLRDGANFRDMELLVGGPIVRSISQSFDQYWNDRWSVSLSELSHVRHAELELSEAEAVVADLALHEEIENGTNLMAWRELVTSAFRGQVQLIVDSPALEDPDSEASAPVQVANGLIKLVDSATEEVFLISAYLIPSPSLEGAIQRAVDRGVRVRILTNSIQSNNHLTAHSAYRNHVRELLNAGADLHEVRTDARDRGSYMLPPLDRKSLALHAKMIVIDHDRVFIGSANLDPRSLRINTEMGLLVTDASLNTAIRANLSPDYDLANAWSLRLNEDGSVNWISDTEELQRQPAASAMQRIEDWFFAHLPIEGEL